MSRLLESHNGADTTRRLGQHRPSTFGRTPVPAIRLLLAGLVLLVAGPRAQQVTRPDTTPIARPAFEYGKGPVVAIDEAHKNTHTYASPQFQGLVELLQRGGYRVRPSTATITSPSLTGVDVLVVSNPGGWEGPDASLNDGEVAALMEWIRSGGSLLLILDHMPAPRNAARLAAALGVTNWHNGSAMVEIPDSLPVGPIIFWRPDFVPAGEPAVTVAGPGGALAYQGADAVLAKHPITEGRGPEERVRRVTTFVGSAFQPPEGAEALMVMPKRAVSLTPQTPGADVRVNAQRTPVGGWLQGAVMKIGKGRAAVFGETGLFSGGPAPDNRSFVLNVMRWLSRVL